MLVFFSGWGVKLGIPSLPVNTPLDKITKYFNAVDTSWYIVLNKQQRTNNKTRECTLGPFRYGGYPDFPVRRRSVFGDPCQRNKKVHEPHVFKLCKSSKLDPWSKKKKKSRAPRGHF